MVTPPANIANHDTAVPVELMAFIAVRSVLIGVSAYITFEHDLFFRHFIGLHLNDKEPYQRRCVLAITFFELLREDFIEILFVDQPVKFGACQTSISGFLECFVLLATHVIDGLIEVLANVKPIMHVVACGNFFPTEFLYAFHMSTAPTSYKIRVSFMLFCVFMAFVAYIALMKGDYP